MIGTESKAYIKGKCVSCEFYAYEEDKWLVGNCSCTTNPSVRKRVRYYNSTKCKAYNSIPEDAFKEKHVWSLSAR